MELPHNREKQVIRFGAVPSRELPDGHARVVNHEAIVTEAVDELSDVHADGRCEHIDWSPVDPVEDQLLGFSRAQDRLRHDQADTRRPGERQDADSAALREVIAEGSPMGQHVENDGDGEPDADQLMCWSRSIMRCRRSGCRPSVQPQPSEPPAPMPVALRETGQFRRRCLAERFEHGRRRPEPQCSVGNLDNVLPPRHRHGDRGGHARLEPELGVERVDDRRVGLDVLRHDRFAPDLGTVPLTSSARWCRR